MMKNHLFRDRAPITEAGWEEIEKEARRTLRALLAARRVAGFSPRVRARLAVRAEPPSGTGVYPCERSD